MLWIAFGPSLHQCWLTDVGGRVGVRVQIPNCIDPFGTDLRTVCRYCLQLRVKTSDPWALNRYIYIILLSPLSP